MQQRRKLSKEGVVLIGVIILAILTTVVLIFSIKSKKTEMSDSLYENMDAFGIEVQEDSVSDLGKVYMKSAKYAIIEWDEQSMKGVIKLSVPDAYDVMVETIEEFNREYSSIEDDSVDLESILKERLISAIENTDQIREKEMSVELIEHENEICIAPSKEIFNYIYDDFLRMSMEMQAGIIGGEDNAEN